MAWRLRALVGALLGIATCGTASTAEPHEGQPNVLLITVDTLRADHLSSYGFSHETSPHVDALAAGGVLFERAIAASAATAPSHASIMTARFPRGHSIGSMNGQTRLSGGTTLAETFKAAGYATGAFVSNMLLQERGFERGFDEYDARLETPELNRSQVMERRAAQTADAALAWIAAERNRPIFVWVHFNDPHGPYTPPRELEDRFVVAPDRYEKKLPVVEALHGWDIIPDYQALPGLDRPSQYRGRYAGEIFYADMAIGRLVGAFDAHPSGRSTVVLLTADHGESFGEDGRYLVHGWTTTPENAHVPFVLRAPGLEPARRQEIVSHVDIMPTLLELAGLEAPLDLDGVALGPHLRRAGAAPKERYVYCDIGREVSAYRSDHFFRVLGVENTLAPGAESPPASRPLWTRNEWHPSGTWERAQTSESNGIAGEILEYTREAVPLDGLPGLDPKTVELLRAMGYVAE